MKRINIGFTRTFVSFCCCLMSFTVCASNNAYKTTSYTTSSNPGWLLSRLGFTEKPWWYNPVITLTGGVVSSHVGQTQVLNMENDYTTYTYAANGGRSNRGLWGGFIGTEFPVYQDWNLDVGLAYYQPYAFSSGNSVLTQGVDSPSSDQYIYSYKVQPHQFLAEAKLLWNVKERYHPYISGGMGIGFNRAYSYTNNAPSSLTYTPEFTNNTTTVFTYNLGVGIDVDIRKNWRVGVGYRFTDFGKTTLGSGNIDTTGFTPTPSQQNLLAQEIIAQLTYLIA